MQCIKTGCFVYIEPYGSWAYGDAFECNGVYLFRLNASVLRPNPKRHFTIHRADMWFDMDVPDSISTLVTTEAENHGYEAVPDPLYKFKKDETDG